MSAINETYQVAVLKLNKDSHRVKKALEKLNIKPIPKSEFIVFSFKVYSSFEFDELKAYFYRHEQYMKLNSNADLEAMREEYLKENLKLPGNLKHDDILEITNHKKEFKRLIKNERIIAGVDMERCIISGIKKYTIVQQPPLCDRRVYVFELNKLINENNRFRNHNPDWDGESPAFYVGQTAKSRQERYNEHLNGIHSNKFVKKYAFIPHEKADKTQVFADKFNIPIENLRYYQALYYEQKMTRILKDNGFGAYSN
jgi:hypothetical protein